MGMENFSLADIKAVTDGNENGFGGNGAWLIIILFLFLFNGNGLFGGGRADGGVVTQGELQRSFDTNTIVNKLNDTTDGLCDGFYAMNTSLLNGFSGVNASISNLAHQGQQCCCEILRSADRNTCDIIKAMHDEGETTRALITQNTIQQLRDDLQSAQSLIGNANQTQNILNSLGRYVTNPPCIQQPFYGYGCGNYSGYTVA